MILKQGHEYRAMPHDGKLIAYIYRGGRCYYIASPYSPEATQALKAAFPQYWTAIRDYGWANPALVPFINEDPMLIVSLVEVGKERWLVGDGKAWIDMQEPPCYDSDFSIEFYAGTFTPRYVGFWGSGTGPTTADRMDCYMYSADGRFCFYTTSQNFEYYIARDTPYTLRYDKGTASLLDESGKTLVSGKTNKPSTTYKFNAYLFAFNRNGVLGGDTAGDNFVGGISKAEGKLNSQPFHYLPFTRNGENGMLDILSGTFYPNANTQGAFTIEITDKE